MLPSQKHVTLIYTVNVCVETAQIRLASLHTQSCCQRLGFQKLLSLYKQGITFFRETKVFRVSFFSEYMRNSLFFPFKSRCCKHFAFN